MRRLFIVIVIVIVIFGSLLIVYRSILAIPPRDLISGLVFALIFFKVFQSPKSWIDFWVASALLRWADLIGCNYGLHLYGWC